VPRRIVALGDVHGDIVALGCILRSRRIIDKKGRWKGGDTHVVLNGDLVGGRDARLLLRYVMRLGRKAAKAGGAVHSLLGNHDVQVFSEKYQSREGKTLFDKYEVEGAEGGGLREVFAGHTRFARFLRERNAILKIGPTLFAHAGINAWAARHHPRRINATIRAWIRHWQGIAARPDPRTEWVARGPGARWSAPSTGPLWTRSFKPGRKAKSGAGSPPDAVTLGRLLARYRVKRMVIGHNPVDTGEIALSHPYYGDAVVMIDSRISRGGRLSCLEIRGEVVEAHYTERTRFGEKLRRRELARLKRKRRMRSSFSGS
jgi:hypothetical protein